MFQWMASKNPCLQLRPRVLLVQIGSEQAAHYEFRLYDSNHSRLLDKVVVAAVM
jgi:hypothetical protein